MQHSLKLGVTNYHFKWIIIPGTTLTERPAIKKNVYKGIILELSFECANDLLDCI